VEITVDGLAMVGVLDAAKTWWEGHRPVDWTEEQHIAQPCVNACETVASLNLAAAVGRLVSLEHIG